MGMRRQERDMPEPKDSVKDKLIAFGAIAALVIGFVVIGLILHYTGGNEKSSMDNASVTRRDSTPKGGGED